MNVPQPMYITSRLRAGIKLDDGAVVSVGHLRGDSYDWMVEGQDGKIIEEGADLRCPMVEDYGQVMGALLSFLSAAAEGGENEDLFAPDTVEWANQHDDELTMLAFELENPEEGE